MPKRNPAKAPAKSSPPASNAREVDRVQTGLRIEKRILKVLKAVAEVHDLTLGDLIEGIVLHAFEGKAPFSKATMQRIDQLRSVYGLDLVAADSHRLMDR